MLYYRGIGSTYFKRKRGALLAYFLGKIYNDEGLCSENGKSTCWCSGYVVTKDHYARSISKEKFLFSSLREQTLSKVQCGHGYDVGPVRTICICYTNRQVNNFLRRLQFIFVILLGQIIVKVFVKKAVEPEGS